MAQGTYTTELDDIDVEDVDLEAEEGVEIDGDVDAWMTEMLSGPSSYDY